MTLTPAPSLTSASRPASTDLIPGPGRRSLVAVTIVALAGCGGETDLVLARVGDASIAASEMTEFIGHLTDDRKTAKSGVDGYLDYLQTLIEKEGLVQEARKRELDKVPAVWRKRKAEKDRRAVKDFVRGQTLEKISISDDELRQHQIDTQRDYQIQMRRLLADSKEDAVEAVRRLRGGEPFGHMPRALCTCSLPSWDRSATGSKLSSA